MVLAAPPLADAAHERALALLARVPLIDGHNDLPYVVRLDPAAKGDLAAYDLGRVHPETDTDIPRMRAGRLAAQFFAAYVPPNHPKPAGFALAQIALMRRIWSAMPTSSGPALRPTTSRRRNRKGASRCS